MCEEIDRIYAVVRIENGEVVYDGPSDWHAAIAWAPQSDTAHGFAHGRDSAVHRARANAQRIRGARAAHQPPAPALPAGRRAACA
jgi:hypothetical protein